MIKFVLVTSFFYNSFMSSKEIKKNAKQSLKKHYLIFVIVCLVAGILGVSYSSSLSILNSEKGAEESASETKYNDSSTFDGLVNSIFDDYLDSVNKKAENVEETKDNIGVVNLERKNGVLARLVNEISTGKVYVTIYNMITSVISSKNIAIGIFVLLVGVVYILIQVLVNAIYQVSMKRVFMEGRKYDIVKPNRAAFLFKTKKVIKATWTITLALIYKYLWWLTVIGGIIKSYSYALVPYIVAENPDINAGEAITLSRKMMDGYKFRLFKFRLSFIGWDILDILTIGISGVFFSNPYKEAALAGFYSEIRSISKENRVENVELLNDTYLYENADIELIKKEYADDIPDDKKDIDLSVFKRKGIRGFLERNFGIALTYDETEDRYNEAYEAKERYRSVRDILDFKQYPDRLFPIKMVYTNRRLENTHYLRHYSVLSLIAIFFIISFGGWIWEVSLNLVTNGTLVNRGVLHGPWLPIYGTGGVMILVLLYRFRRNPALFVVLTIILCGIVEYGTGTYLEMTKGIKWWDYAGYFINISGRICAEGLLVFALGGVAITYAVAPAVDNLIRKANKKVLAVVCIVLVLIFIGDSIYSSKYPNTGEGVTNKVVLGDYDVC